MEILAPNEIIQKIISSQGYFPGNQRYPLLIYKQVFSSAEASSQSIQAQLAQNNWGHSWVDRIYDFHHYHSNTHEVLVIIAGDCEVQFGGKNGSIYTVNRGDVVVIPAGVAHKSLSMTNDFSCIGAYTSDVGYDMNHGNEEEYSKAIESIKRIGLPKKDPIFGEKGILFSYWK